MNERRLGILIASSRFPNEPKLEELRCPENDVDGLHEVLTSKDRGGFTETIVLKNEPHYEVLKNINRVLKQTDKDDLVLIFYSGHGKLDLVGRLHLATVDTELDALESTSIPVESIRNFIDVSPSNKSILLLDCCYSGAVDKALLRGGVEEQLQHISRGRGIYILTGSTDIQMAQEKETDQYGLFSKHVIEGIRRGNADKNANGFITMDDLYGYVHEKVLEEGPQEPMRWAVGVRGNLIISRSGKTPRKERAKQIREIIFELAKKGFLPDDILDKARQVIALEQEQLAEEDRTYDGLLDQLLKKSLEPGEFIREWDGVRSRQEQERKLREEKQRKVAEERQRLEEEKQRKAEQKQKFEEEQKRKQVASKAEEERKQEQERKLKAEEEKRRKEKEEQERKAEREKRRKIQEEQERKAVEEKRRKEQELKQKTEEERQKKETEAKRKAEVERKKKEIKAKLREEKAEIIPDTPEPESTAPSEPKSPEPRKTGNALKFGVFAGIAVLLIAGLWWWFSQHQVNEVRQEMEKLKRQVLNLENSISELDKPEKIDELFKQRDTLSRQVEGLSERAIKVGLELQMEQLQDRLKQLQIQLANKEKELITARKGRIFVHPVPDNSAVKILNIDQGFRQGIKLEPGKYHVQTSAEGYYPQDRWIEISAGEEKRINFELKPHKIITNSIGMKFVLIPAGEFIMGSPSDEPERDTDERQHEVNISKPFYLQTTEVSQGQWERVMGYNPSNFKNCGDDCPVEQVFWNDAQEFISKLNQMEDTNKYRLPTEAEWEYACRAGTKTPFFTGECISTDQANYDGNYPAKNCPKGEYREKTVKVGSFRPNDWGLYDMHGNVLELVQDWKGDYPTGTITDPKGPDEGKSGRVLRGGSWVSHAGELSSANRDWGDPIYRYYGILGFRVALDF